MNDWSDSAATFGDRLAVAREAQGLSQAELARQIGMRLQTVRNWEEDRSEPRANKMQMLAGLLNVSMIWLMTGQGAGGVAAEQSEPRPAAPIADLIAELHELRLGQIRAVERMSLLEERLRSLGSSA